MAATLVSISLDSAARALAVAWLRSMLKLPLEVTQSVAAMPPSMEGDMTQSGTPDLGASAGLEPQPVSTAAVRAVRQNSEEKRFMWISLRLQRKVGDQRRQPLGCYSVR